MNKKRNWVQIIKEIKILLDELSIMHGSSQRKSSLINVEKYSGPSGGVRLLIKEGFFNKPQNLPGIVNCLHQEGFNYSRQVISTALLRLVRSRFILRRLNGNKKGKEKWIYAERK